MYVCAVQQLHLNPHYSIQEKRKEIEISQYSAVPAGAPVGGPMVS